MEDRDLANLIIGATLMGVQGFTISLIKRSIADCAPLTPEIIEELRKEAMANLITSKAGGMTQEQEAKLYKGANTLLRITLEKIILESAATG